MCGRCCGCLSGKREQGDCSVREHSLNSWEQICQEEARPRATISPVLAGSEPEVGGWVLQPVGWVRGGMQGPEMGSSQILKSGPPLYPHETLNTLQPLKLKSGIMPLKHV